MQKIFSQEIRFKDDDGNKYFLFFYALSNHSFTLSLTINGNYSNLFLHSTKMEGLSVCETEFGGIVLFHLA